MIGTFDKKTSKVSKYQPPKEVGDFTSFVKQDYKTGQNILTDTYEEFDGNSILSEMNENQKAFNTYITDENLDPDEKWRWQGRRPIVRNKIIGMAAQLTANILYPNIFPQNNSDEEDKLSALIMKDLIKWNIDNSDYERSFVFGVIAGLVNPATILKAEYSEALQTIKVKNKNGSISKKEVIDEVLSGFNTNVIPVDEFLITNVYEFDLQKQKAIIRRRFIEFDEAEALHGHHENFKFVTPGVKVLYVEEEGQFYDIKDDELDTLVEEVTYYNRREDTEVVFVNGIYLGDSNVEANLIKHRDNKNKPKYPFVKGIHEMVDEGKFFYGKSAVAKIKGDEELLNKMWGLTMDGSYLDVMKPILISNTNEEIDKSVMFPASVTLLEADARITPLTTGSNLNSGYRAIGEIEKSITESSQSEIRSGVEAGGQQTAFEISRLEKNAIINQGLSIGMIARMIEEFGDLMIDIILMHQTVGQTEEILGGGTKTKFRTFLLQNEPERGKKITKKIMFTDELMGRPMTDEQFKDEQFKIFDDEGGINGDTRLFKINPYRFSDMSFKAKVSADSLVKESDALSKALKLEGYDRMITNPFVEGEEISRDFLVEVFAEGDSEKYMKKTQQVLGANLRQEEPVRGQNGRNKGSNLVNQMTNQNSLQGLIRS
jgi:hypothetical protein